MLKEEVEEAVRSLKAGKPPGVNNISSELLKNGSEATTTVLTTTRPKIWEKKELPKEWTQPLVVRLRKKGSPKQCQNYCTISLQAIQALYENPSSAILLNSQRGEGF